MLRYVACHALEKIELDYFNIHFKARVLQHKKTWAKERLSLTMCQCYKKNIFKFSANLAIVS